MNIKAHTIHATRIAEITADRIIVNTIGDGLDLVGNIYYQEFDAVIIHEKNITPDFFDLKSGMAGEILQKFSNYRIQLFIIGDFSKYTSKSLQDFIFESNNGNHINFVSSVEDVMINYKR